MTLTMLQDSAIPLWHNFLHVHIMSCSVS